MSSVPRKGLLPWSYPHLFQWNHALWWMLGQCDAHEMAEGNSDNHKNICYRTVTSILWQFLLQRELSFSSDGRPCETIQISTQQRKKSYGYCLHSILHFCHRWQWCVPWLWPFHPQESVPSTQWKGRVVPKASPDVVVKRKIPTHYWLIRLSVLLA